MPQDNFSIKGAFNSALSSARMFLPSSATLQRVRQDWQDTVRDTRNSMTASFASAVPSLRSRTVRQDDRPRANAQVKDAPRISDSSPMPLQSVTRPVSGLRSGVTIPAAPPISPGPLAPEQVEELRGFFVALSATQAESGSTVGFAFMGLANAFELDESHPGLEGEKSSATNVQNRLLPREVSESLRRKIDPPNEEKRNFLSDPESGFIAGIAVKVGAPLDGASDSGGSAKEPVEVIINFPRSNRDGPTIGQGASRLFDVLLRPVPKNFEQAAKLVRRMERHLEGLNAVRETMDLPPIKLTVIGQSSGGAMATYAALRAANPEKIRTVAIEPSLLGPSARARIDPGKLANAQHCVTAITVDRKNKVGHTPTAPDSIIGAKCSVSADDLMKTR